MQDKFRHKYRIESTRLQSWNYGWNGAYFITICTHNRIHYFGEIVETQNIASLQSQQNHNKSQNIASLQSQQNHNKSQDIASPQPQSQPQRYEMKLSEIGRMAEKYWLEIPEHFPFVKLDQFVVMPNHVHGIIIIDKQIQHTVTVETQNIASLQSQQNHNKSQNIASLQSQQNHNKSQNIASLQSQQNHNKSQNKFGPQSQNLASIIRGYKIGVTKYSHRLGYEFKWQSRFYDHIIRNEESYHKIQNYIINNPQEWANDELNNVIGKKQ